MGQDAKFYALLALTLIFRAWLAAVVPITGDEAYFIWWGWYPAWGFYDHPPMIGWWLAGLLPLHDAEWWLRLPLVVQPAILALTVRWALPHLVPAIERARRDWIALLILLAPASLWNVFITTDTPLIYFSVLSGLAWLRAARDDAMGWYLVAGLCLAGAVLSKYFAAILGFAFLIDAIHRRTPRARAGLTLAFACTVPALCLMAWWNGANCWPNYMFNFVNRHEHAGWSLTTPLLYLASLLYLLTPPALWVASRELMRRGASADFQGRAKIDGEHVPALAVLVAVPFLLFAVLSLVKQVGLHWLLSFVPFALIWLGLRLPLATLHRLGQFFLGFALVHVALILAISMLPLETWQKNRRYDGLVLTFAHQALADALASDLVGDGEKKWVLAMDGYSNAVTLGYNLRRYVIVFGEASSHARHDDIVTDFRELAGRNSLVLRKSEPDLAYYRQFFNKVQVDSFDIRGARFWRVKGEGFDFPAYRDKVLSVVKSKYYALPPWLPQRGCYFCDRYFPEETCCR